jgi:hypothetical protein
MKGKFKNWFNRQSKQSKIILLITLILNFGISIYKVPFYLLSQYGFGAFSGRLLGELLGVLIPIFLIAVIIASILYLIFRSVAEKYKNFFDYFTIVFLIISVILLYFGNFYKPF